MNIAPRVRVSGYIALGWKLQKLLEPDVEPAVVMCTVGDCVYVVVYIFASV